MKLALALFLLLLPLSSCSGVSDCATSNCTVDECSMDNDCLTHEYCDEPNALCVESISCSSEQDCSGDTPVCDNRGTCIPAPQE